MKILLTGGAGFIGSNLAEQLLAGGHQVFCIDNLDNFYNIEIKKLNLAKALVHPNYTFQEGDIRNKKLVETCFINFQPELVIHLAARAGVRPSIQQPALYYSVNIDGTLNLLEAMKNHDVKKMLFASSSSVYGNNKKVPFTETDNVDHPISPYAATKKSGELLCYNYHHLYDLDIFCLRFFSVYGPRQRPEMAISAFTRKILAGIPIQMFGDGSSQRDYTYVDDIVEGMLLSMKKLKGFEVLNLGESSTISLADLITTLESALDKKAIIDELPQQPGDVQITYADISKAKQLIGYQPHTTIQKGINKYISWYQSTYLVEQ